MTELVRTPIHLATGVRVCGKPRSWCRRAIIIENGIATNATEARERATCVACCDAHDHALAHHAETGE